MKKKAMIIATIYSFVSHFEKNDIKILQELGYEVVVASNFEGYKGELEELNVEKLDIPFTRSPISLKNIKAFFKLNKYLKENKVSLIHCHTPVGGVAGRIIGKLNKIPRIIYTAHGFHFFDGAPKINWIVYYPIEKTLSKFTDTLITINKEDYERAKTFYAKKVEYIPGVGIDVEKIQNIKVDREQKRKELGLSMNDTILLSVGELSSRKNHITPIRALTEIKNKNIKYLIAGAGPLENYLKSEIYKLGLENQVRLLGYRKDIYELCNISDIYIFPSQREGLGLAGLEGMAAGLPLISANINGIKDYTQNGKTGYCIDRFDIQGFKKGIEKLVNNKKLRIEIGNYNQKIAEKYDSKNSRKIMEKVYKEMGEKIEDKIVIFNGNIGLGGITEFIFDLAILLKANRKNYKILCLKIDEISLTKSKKYGLNIEVIGGERHYYNPLNLYSIYKSLKDYNVIHTNDFPSQLWTAVLKIFLKRKLLILTEHSTSNNRRKYKIFKYIDKYIHYQYDYIVSITKEVENSLLKWYLVKKNKKYVVINNGINLLKFRDNSEYTREKFNLKKHDTVLVMVSRIDFKTKDYETLLKAIVDLNIKLLIIGEGPDTEKLKNKVTELKIEKKVYFLGRRDDVEKILPLCNIGILSSHYEGFGLAAIEMMACGLPTIVSNVDGLRQIVEGYGLIFEKGNEKDLEEKLKKLLEDKEYYKNIRKKCIKRSLEYSIEKSFNKYLEIYNKQS